MPKPCPTRNQAETSKDVAGYQGSERQALMRAADEAPFKPDRQLRSRVEELVFYAKARGVRRVGVAFCVTLLKEAQVLARLLEEEHLETELICCRVGAVDHSEIGLPKRHPEKFAAICNPVAQAKLLNERKVDLVAQLGLCIGHDLVLQEECEAPVTTLVVKDRVHDHSPVRALRR